MSYRRVPAAELRVAVDEMIQELLRADPPTLAARKQLVYQWTATTFSTSITFGIKAAPAVCRPEALRGDLQALSGRALLKP